MVWRHNITPKQYNLHCFRLVPIQGVFFYEYQCLNCYKMKSFYPCFTKISGFTFQGVCLHIKVSLFNDFMYFRQKNKKCEIYQNPEFWKNYMYVFANVSPQSIPIAPFIKGNTLLFCVPNVTSRKILQPVRHYGTRLVLTNHSKVNRCQ